MFFLSAPHQLQHAPSRDHQVAHRCGRGRYNFATGVKVSCINPHHLTVPLHRVSVNIYVNCIS
ncbi:hypothetical protein F5B20DRAFT_551111 [Whalleya microplaca]|nr:hypothetical protein F5B20DRAFT_551111 [Whalleya microplaca]